MDKTSALATEGFQSAFGGAAKRRGRSPLPKKSAKRANMGLWVCARAQRAGVIHSIVGGEKSLSVGVEERQRRVTGL